MPKIIWVNSSELADLIKDDRVIGPFQTIEIKKLDLPWISGGDRCNKAAEEFAYKNNYNVIKYGSYFGSLSFPISTTSSTYTFYKKVKP